MNLGLYRREHMQSGDPHLIGDATVHQFQQTHGAIQAWSEAQHLDDGAHGAITAAAVDVAGALVANTLTARGPATTEPIPGVKPVLTIRDDRTLRSEVVGPVDPRSEMLVIGQQGATIHIAGEAVNTEAVLNLYGASRVPGDEARLFHSDGNTGILVGALAQAFLVNKGVRELGRSFNMGTWVDVPFNAAHFAGSGGMTWTVASGNVTTNQYTLVGTTLTWTCAVFSSALAGAASGGLVVTVPDGMSIAAFAFAAGKLFNGASSGLSIEGSGTTLNIVKIDGSNFASPDANVFVFFTFIGEISI